MLKPRSLVTAVAVAALCVSAAWSAPLADGTVVDGEYDAKLIDTYVYGAPDETQAAYHGTGLDIDSLHFTMDGAWRYLGLTVDPLDDGQDYGFDPNGSPASYSGQTAFNISFYATEPDLAGGAPPSPAYYLNLIVSDDGLEQGQLVEWNAATGRWVTTNLVLMFVTDGVDFSLDPTIAQKYDVQFGRDLEIHLSEDLFLGAAGSAEYFVAQLDDLGGWDDDQMVGHLPEPTALALLALGGAWLLRRRRRG
jgi:hypothetical protein